MPIAVRAAPVSRGPASAVAPCRSRSRSRSSPSWRCRGRGRRRAGRRRPVALTYGVGDEEILAGASRQVVRPFVVGDARRRPRRRSPCRLPGRRRGRLRLRPPGQRRRLRRRRARSPRSFGRRRVRSRRSRAHRCRRRPAKTTESGGVGAGQTTLPGPGLRSRPRLRARVRRPVGPGQRRRSTCEPAPEAEPVTVAPAE